MTIYKIYIAFLTAVFLIGTVSCGEIGGKVEPDSLAVLFHRIIVTNNSSNEISVIYNQIKAGLSNSTGWDIVSPDYSRWIGIAKTNDVFYLDATYLPGALYYVITEDGTAIGIITGNNTNYFISIEEKIARELYPELTNDTLMYGFSYLYYDYDTNVYTPWAFSSDLISNVIDYGAIYSDYVIIVENDSMKLSLSFSGWVDPNDIDYGDPNKSTNLTAVTNFSY